MKTKYLLVILVITLIGVQSRTVAQIDKEQAIGIVKSSLTNEEQQNYNVLVFPELIQDQEFHLSPYHVLHSAYDSSWLFFIDMYPNAQWAHDCKYIFLDQQTGNYTSINYRIPPQDYWYGWEYINDPYPYPEINPLQASNQGDSNIANPDPHKYAVFICWDEGEPCRWNNLSHIYCGIKRNYGFMDENIFVLSGNGNYNTLPTYNLDNSGNEQDFDGPCTKDSIVNVFTNLSLVMTDKDILFVYATTHGDTIGNNISYLRLNGQDSIIDYELAALVDSIHCSQKIFGIDVCFSGGFVDDLQGNHSVVQTSVSANIESIISQGGLGFHDMSFWWGTALRGYYPYSKEYPYRNGSKIGEHDSLFTISSIDSVDFNPDDTLGGNNDGFIQFQEAFNFAFRYASDIRDRGGQNYIDEGFQGDLLTLNGIEGRVDTSQEISGSFLIGRKLTLAPGVVLTDYSNMQNPLNLFLNDSTEILVEDGSTLNINGYYTKFNGCSGHSFVNIKGNTSQTYMNFLADNDATIHVNFDNPSKSYVLSGFNFKNAGIQASCNQLKFTLADFDHSPIEFSGNRLELNQSELVSGSDIVFTGYEQFILDSNDLTDCSLDLNYGNISIENDNDFINSSITIGHPIDEAASIDIIGNDFDNDSTVAANAVVTIEDYRNFRIDSNNFRYARGRGIELFNAGWDGREVQQIAENAIELKQPSTSVWSDVGINVYCSKAYIHNNKIRKNNYGLVGFHNSDLFVLGDSTATENFQTQFFGDNTRSQCLFNKASFPTEFHWNVIRDTTLYSNQFHPFIKTVEYDVLMQDTTGSPYWMGNPYLDVIHNCWINKTNLYGRLIPHGAYIYDTLWCPGVGGHTKSENIPGSLYSQALNDVASGNYTLAETGFKQVIAEYPENKYALASLKELFALNPALYNADYSSLKTYCDSTALNPGDSLLGKTAEWFSIRCNIENENFQQAVNSLDSILTNPGTYADSVFALIDLCEVFAEIIDTSGLKLSLATLNPQIIPDSYHQFKEKRKDWIDLLLRSGNNTSHQDIMPVQAEIDLIKPCKLTAVYPNPAKDHVKISYSVFKKGEVSISVCSSAGIKLTECNAGISELGNYIFSLNSSNYPSGIYFISLYYENCNIDNVKLIRLK